MDRVHAATELVGKIPAGQVDISSVESVRRCPAKVAIVCSSQPIRARSVRHRCRVVWVENFGTSAADAIRCTTFDRVHKLGWLRVITAGLREGTAVPVPCSDSTGVRDSPTAAHRSQPSTATIRSSRFFVVSARSLRAEVGGVEIVGAQRAQQVTSQRCVVGQGEHHRSSGPVPRRRLRGCSPTAVRWESTAASSIGAQAHADAHCRADRAYISPGQRDWTRTAPPP